MSTPSAHARYIISADDRSKAAVASAIRGFKEMERGIKGSLRTLNAGLAIFLGVQLKQGFRNVLQATAQSAEGQRGFARALEETRRAAKNLLAAKSGLPAATQSMKELRDILKDPSVVAAADAITSTLIKGFGNAAIAVGKVVGGIRELTKERTISAAKTRQDVIDALDFQIKNVDEQLARARSGSGRIKGEASFGAGTTGGATIAFLQAERKRLLEAQQRVLDLPATPARGHGAVVPISTESRTKSAIDRERRAEEARIEALKQSAEILKAEGALLEFRHDQTMKSVDAAGEYLQELKETRQEAATFAKTMNPQIRLEMEQNFEYLNELHREAISEMTDYVRNAREGMRGALADFLFDPFEDGLKGMGKSFVDTIRRMIAEMAAAKIFASKSAGGFGFGGFLEGIFGGFGKGAGIAPGENDWMKKVPGVGLPDLGKFFKFPSLPGFASGGSFTVGGSGGVDQNVVAFRASRGEQVDITPAGRGGASVVINNHIDARGATQDAIRLLPEILKQNNRELEFQIIDGLRRNKYRLA